MLSFYVYKCRRRSNSIGVACPYTMFISLSLNRFGVMCPPLQYIKYFVISLIDTNF